MKKIIGAILFFLFAMTPSLFALDKNVADQKWGVFCFTKSDGVGKTGDAAQITANVRIDGVAANPIDDTNPTEMEDGYYVFDVTAAETNGNYIMIAPESSTSGIQCVGCPSAVWTVLSSTALGSAIWNTASGSGEEDSYGNILDDVTAEDGTYYFTTSALEGSWDAVIGDHTVADSFGDEYVSASDLDDSGAPWDALIGDHTIPDSFGDEYVSAGDLDDTATVAAAVEDEVWTRVVINGDTQDFSAEQLLRLISSFVGGGTLGGGTTTIVFYKLDDSGLDEPAITMTVNSVGDRSAVTYDPGDVTP